MNIKRIVRHYCIAMAREYKSANPEKFTPKGKLSKSAKARYAKTHFTDNLIKLQSNYARAYNLALGRGIDMSKDIVIKDVWSRL